METVILMSAYNADFHREKAVRTSAELLRDSGIAFFPLDIRRLLKNSFSHQIKLIPYKELGEISLKESADGITDPRTLSKDGFCMRVRDVLIDLGSGPSPATYGIFTIMSPAFRSVFVLRSCMSWDMFFSATISCWAWTPQPEWKACRSIGKRTTRPISLASTPWRQRPRWQNFFGNMAFPV